MDGGLSFFGNADGIAGIFLVIVVLLAAALVLLRKSPFLLLGRLFRPVYFAFIGLLRALRFLPKTTAGARKTASATTGFTPTAWAAFARPFARQTETDKALGEIAEQAHRYLKREKGTFFAWLQPQEGMIDAARGHDGETNKDDYEKAKHFFSYDIPVRSNPQSLYEDIHDAMIVDQFRYSDKMCLFLLSEMRKIINDNVRILSVLFSFIVSFVFIVNIFYSSSINFAAFFTAIEGFSIPYLIEIPYTGLVITIDRDDINRGVFGFLSCMLGILMMWIFYQTEYSHFQRNNGRELNNFLTRYLAQLNADFKTVERNAMASIVGSQEPEQNLNQQSLTGVVNMQWLAFRVFFIESFLRSIVYQILRNSSYYLLFVPVAFFITIFVIAYLVGFAEIRLLHADSAIYQQNTFYLFFFLMLVLYFGYLKRSVEFVLDSIREQEWTQFHTLNVHEAMSAVIEKYTSEIVFYRNRFRGMGRE